MALYMEMVIFLFLIYLVPIACLLQALIIAGKLQVTALLALAKRHMVSLLPQKTNNNRLQLCFN